MKNSLRGIDLQLFIVYNFLISSWQTSPSLLQLIQFRADSFSRAGISSVFVSCRPKLDNNSEDIFFAAFLFLVYLEKYFQE